MVSDTYRKIGKRVKHFRINRGLSQDQLADGICSRQTISLLENGQHFPSADFVKKIAARLSVPVYEIMVDESRELEAKVQLEIIKVYVETAEYSHVVPLIEELNNREDLLEYQRRELVLCQAECQMRTGDAEEAVTILTKLQQRLEMERDTDDHFMARLYDKLGTAYFLIPSIATAHAHYMRAYQLSLRFPKTDILVAQITYNLGMACRHLNRQVEAIEYLSRAELFFKDIADSKRLAHVLFELGISYRFHNEYERADHYLQESLALYRALNMMSMVNHVRQNHAVVVLSKTDPELAIQQLLSCAQEFESVGDVVRVAYTYAFIASILLRQKSQVEAAHYLNLSLSMVPDIDAQENPRLVFAFQVNAEYLLEIKNYEKCIEYSFKASNLFDKMGLGREAADSLKISARAYRELGMLEKAYDIAEQVNEMLCRVQDQVI